VDERHRRRDFLGGKLRAAWVAAKLIASSKMPRKTPN
jgi:hypothetical protein